MANKQVIQKPLNVFFKFNNKAHSHNEISIPSPTELTTGDSTTTAEDPKLPKMALVGQVQQQEGDTC